MKQNHNFYSNLAFNIAEINIGKTKKNPSVGCVIVKNNSVIRINIGTITNSFFPSDINFVKKLANKKYPNKIEIKLKDFNLQEELKKPNKKIFDWSRILKKLVFCIRNWLK